MKLGDVTLRINDFLRSINLTANALANVLGMLPQTLWQQLAGQAKLSAVTIVSILERYPDLSAEWLLRGEGAMYKGAKTEIHQQNTEGDNVVGTKTQTDETEVAYLKSQLSKKDEQIAALLEIMKNK